jgi:indole-3-glycerol phosphate synthase
MNCTFLDNILSKKRERVAAAKSEPSGCGIRERAESARRGAVPNRLYDTLSDPSRVNVIAEIKRASPSKGVINDAVDVAEIARSYDSGGACAISVLTEEDFFRGSIEDLRNAREATSLPILRKDFTVDEFQIYEAAEAGADAILLIVAALEYDEIEHLMRIAGDLGLDALVEVHDGAEMEIARSCGCRLIGVNNRSLHTFDVSLDVSRTLAAGKPSGSVLIAESGISSGDEIRELRSLGYDGFLVGETLMRNGDPRAMLKSWI